jgi:hypothetical protein
MSNVEMAESGCPQCGVSTSLLHPIDQGMRLRLEKEGTNITFEAVCTACFKNLSKGLSNATLLQAEQTIQGNYKKNLWQNRFSLIRQAHTFVLRQEHSEAAICYEKYIKILQVVYEKEFNDLTASLFSEHPKEVTVLCSSLWSLVEIYDLHAQYKERQEACAAKVGELLPYTNLFANIAKHSAVKMRHAKNPTAYRKILQSANIKTGNCFIASIAFEDRNDPTLVILRQFRSQVLLRSVLGKNFVRAYYRYSPAAANRLQHFSAAKRLLRTVLPPFGALLKFLFKLR